jgi:hypothetical protein
MPHKINTISQFDKLQTYLAVIPEINNTDVPYRTFLVQS